VTKDKEEIQHEELPHEDDALEEELLTDTESEAGPEEMEKPQDELETAKSEAAEYLDGWQRARAEFANYKKRVERENEAARQRITAELILNYLGIMDDLERALENAPENEDFQEWVSGIELIYHKFTAILEAEGVETIEAEDERFDPNLHEAISYEDSQDLEGGSIIAVTQRGYKLGDRIIRPAMVRVAK
jgi:molecular chaperone GrpE